MVTVVTKSPGGASPQVPPASGRLAPGLYGSPPDPKRIMSVGSDGRGSRVRE